MQSKKVNLPEAESAEFKTEKHVTLLITSKGQIELNGKNFVPETLFPVLARELNERSKRIVEIQADKEIEFRLFGKLIEIAKQAGADDFVLATEAIQPK